MNHFLQRIPYNIEIHSDFLQSNMLKVKLKYQILIYTDEIFIFSESFNAKVVCIYHGMGDNS